MIYGVLTKQAVATYQEKHSLKRDGIAGPETIGHLLHSSDVQININNATTVKIQEEPNDPNQALTSDRFSLAIKGESVRIFSQGDRGN